MRKLRILFLSGLLLTGLACQLITGASVTPTPTDPPLMEPPTQGITLPFSDDFSVNQYGWPIGLSPGTYSDTTYEIVSGAYRWTATAHKNAYAIAWPSLPAVSQLTVTVDARLVSGKADDSDYGLIYRTLDGQQYFSFALMEDKFSIWHFDKTDGWQEMIPSKTDSAILPGEVNRLKLIVDHDSYTFFANGKKLAQFSDQRISKGRPGLGINIYTAGNTAVYEFDNFAATSP